MNRYLSALRLGQGAHSPRAGHADHFSGTIEMAQELGVPVIMHRDSPRPMSTCGWMTAKINLDSCR